MYSMYLVDSDEFDNSTDGGIISPLSPCDQVVIALVIKRYRIVIKTAILVGADNEWTVGQAGSLSVAKQPLRIDNSHFGCAEMTGKLETYPTWFSCARSRRLRGVCGGGIAGRGRARRCGPGFRARGRGVFAGGRVGCG